MGSTPEEREAAERDMRKAIDAYEAPAAQMRDYRTGLPYGRAPAPDEALPEPADVMEAGFSLSDALQWWSVMTGAEDRDPKVWWDRLRRCQAVQARQSYPPPDPPASD